MFRSSLFSILICLILAGCAANVPGRGDATAPPTISLPSSVSDWNSESISAETAGANVNYIWWVTEAKYSHADEDSTITAIFASGPSRHLALHTIGTGCYGDMRIAEMHGDIIPERLGGPTSNGEFRTSLVSFIGEGAGERLNLRWTFSDGNNWQSPKTANRHYAYLNNGALYKLYLISDPKLNSQRLNSFVDGLLAELSTRLPKK